MSRLRIKSLRLVVVGGLAAVGGASYIILRKIRGEKTASVIAECRRGPNHSDDIIEASHQYHPSKWNDNWDFRKPFTSTGDNMEKDDFANDVPTSTRHVILIRHGHYRHAEKQEMKFLTEIGREQAMFTRDRLKSLQIKFGRLVASTKLRAQETANIIEKGLGDIKREDCSILEEVLFPYIIEPTPKDLYRDWRLNLFNDNPRIEAAFRKYIHRASPSQKEDSYDLLVCHGNVIRYFVCRALQFPLEGYDRLNISNCSITWLAIEPDGNVYMREMSSIGHLPKNLVTES